MRRWWRRRRWRRLILGTREPAPPGVTSLLTTTIEPSAARLTAESWHRAIERMRAGGL